MTAASDRDDDPLLTVRDARKRLNVGRSLIYDALATGRVHGVRFGRSWRIPTSTVDELARTGIPSAPTSTTPTP